MENLIKSFVYSTLGMFSINVERSEKWIAELKELQKEQKVEGEKIVNSLFENSTKTGKKLGEQVGSFTNETLKKFTLANASQLEELTQRLAVLEGKNAKQLEA
jgi:polyhydroxyalkanoate synthesis regulator phasin